MTGARSSQASVRANRLDGCVTGGGSVFLQALRGRAPVSPLAVWSKTLPRSEFPLTKITSVGSRVGKQRKV